jgi:putative ABC transport system permease protein
MLVALSGIAFADMLISMQLGFQAALYDSNTQLHRRLNADLILISPQARNISYMSSFPRRRLLQAMSVSGVEAAEPVYSAFSDWKHPQTHKETSLLMIGFNPDYPAFTMPEVQQQLGKLKILDTMLFDQASRGDYKAVVDQVARGQEVRTESKGRTITVAGLFQIGASFAGDGTLMMSDQTFLRVFSGRQPAEVSVGLIKLQPGYQDTQVAGVLKSLLPEDVRVLTLEEFANFEKDYWQRNTAIGFVFSLGTIMGFMVGVIIVYQVLSTDVNDHMAEYATFKAMGYGNGYLLTVVFEEAVILAVLGFIPGMAVSLGLYHLTRNATNLPMYMTLARATFVLVLTIVMCMISGAIATRKLQAADPADIF